MTTFLEILFTAALTFTAGFLFIRYQPKKKVLKFKKKRGDARALLLLLTGISIFSAVSYLVSIGLVIIKW